MSSSSSQGQEQQFKTQPHPAKTNNPGDLEPPQLGGGLNTNPELQAFHTPGPYIPNPTLLQNAGEPKTRDELHARSAELNK
ncbi:uncharacterized protein PHACADRAFT_259497 [Phanerochaete carnosa HHB-10118-sp]|uniref:Uncharacterized protein n=1 Tax=Phanerochaete carnosa (strain HHB-10118-sp) TaxID=650164 RepID=K5VP78_PHACS|nr:uncharacterized protein PHACADRAFT_259497 [Phanerochaete carnosa HHB-10118-sp]EKM53268.1 hypothetical protein PHACADRAFT_259497 [Phanerochaete carnosa HHB-10118-sp]